MLLGFLLIITFSFTLVMGFKVYSLNPDSNIHKLSALSICSISITAFLEYEIFRSTSIEQVDFIAYYHTAANIIIIYTVVSLGKIFRPASPKSRYSFFENIFFSLYTIVGFALFIAHITTNQQLVIHSFEDGLWQYILINDNEIVITLINWFILSVLLLSIYYWQSYWKAETNNKKRLLFWLAIVFSILPPLMVYEFGNLHVNMSKSYYIISPFFAVFGLALTWVHTNFKLFVINPIAAMDNILDSMNNLMIIMDQNFNIKHANNAAFIDLPFLKKDLLSMNLHSFANELKIKDLDYLIGKITTLTDDESFEYETPVQLDEKKYYKFTISPVFNSQKIKTGYILIADNLTDYKNAEVKLIEYNHELERSNNELERFAYIASHDLKTPLRNVVSFLNLIQRKTKVYKDESLNEYIDIAISGATQMNQLIKDVLEISRINNNELQKESIDLNDTIFSICKMIQKPMTTSNASIQSDYLPTIEADQTQIKQLFQNLIENGIKYNKDEQPTIKIFYEEQEEHHLFQIADNGIGIQKDYHQKVFEMFKRLHTLSDYDGTGIGLAICKKIANLYGGNIWLQSEQGKGSTFFFTLKKAS